MNREQLARLLNANAEMVIEQRRLRGINPTEDPSTILILGSQSVHGAISDYDLPERATLSMEADLAYLPGRQDEYCFDDPVEDIADILDGPTGEGSLWQEDHGYYSQGVEPDTACLPEGWEDRLVPFDDPELPNGIRVMCLDPTDLCAAKMARGEPKDSEFVSQMIDSGQVDAKELRRRYETIPVKGEFTVDRKRNGLKLIDSLTVHVARDTASGDVFVHSYTRADGTQVHEHWRSRPS